MRKLLFLEVLLPVFLLSNPSNPIVISGEALFFQNSNVLEVISKSNRTIINWGDFSIGSNEITHIIQPDAFSAVLNRVLSANSSEILGSLQSNGTVFLINPNGVLFGANAKIDVNGLLASTLDVSNAEFLAGNDMKFSGPSKASIENLGFIKVDEGGVFLLGRHIVNEKDIVAMNSNVHLGAGQTILLRTNQSRIFIQPNFKEIAEGIGIDHRGSIIANHTELRVDGNLYSLAIKQSGAIQTPILAEKNGEVYLIAKQGAISLEGQARLETSGGSIHVLGKNIYLNDQTTISSKSENCGGDILIGGSFGGKDSNILNADYTLIGEGVFIDASATQAGHSGNVSIFALGTAEFRGHIEARGGQLVGDGGIIEVSGIQDLIFKGTADTRSFVGIDGLLILDPTDITISGAATANGAFDGGSPLNTFSGTAATATLNNGDLNTALQTNNVLVTTTSAFAGTGNITIGATTSLNLNTSHTLTLSADNDITVTSAFSMTDLGAGTSVLNLNAGNNVTFTNTLTCVNLDQVNITTTTGNILIDNDITATGAPLTLTSGNDVISQGLGVNGLTANSIVITADNDISINNALSCTGGGGSTAISFSANNGFNLNDVLTLINWNTATISTSIGDIIFDQDLTATNVGTVTFNSANDIINQGVTNLFNDTISGITQLNFNATRDFVVNSQMDINNFLSCTITADRDCIINNDFEPDNTSTLTINAGNNITMTTVGSLIDANNGSLLEFIAGNDFSISEPITLTNVDSTTVTAGNDITVLNAFVSNTTGNITLIADNDVHIGPGTIVSQVGTTSGTVTITTGRDLNVIGGATAGSRSQIGFSGSSVSSAITLTIGRDINVTAGSNSNSVALIGHGFASAGTYTGDIIIHSVGRNVTLTGDLGATGTVKFAQIGHTRFSGASVSSFSGNIRGSTVDSPALIHGTLSLVGGADTTDFALFGHGGRDSNAIDTYSGEIRVQANTVSMTGGTSADCNASIGFYAVAQGAGTNPIVVNSPSVVQVISDTSITMVASTDGIVSIGARALNSATHPATLTLDLVDIQTGDNLTMTSGSGAETDATIGAFANVGTSETALTMTIGGDLLINVGTGAVAQIVNGNSSTATKNSTIQVTGNITPTVAGAFTATIDGSAGNLSVTAQGSITLPNLTHIENLGGSDGTLSITGGSLLLHSGGFIRNSGTGTTTFTTTSSNLSVSNSSFITSIGNLTGNIATSLTILDNASIRSTSGTSTITAETDLTLTGSASGSAFMDSSGSGTYLAGRDINLSGVSAMNEGYIENTTGNLQITAGRDIIVGNYGRAENSGTGSLTLVVDNQNPTSPSIGSGAFELLSLGAVGRVGGGPLRIFTAVRSQNLVEGTSNLNGNTFTPGTLYVDTEAEQWGTYFPNSFGGSPFTFFYKDGAPVPAPTPADMLAIDPNAFVPFYELFFILSDYQQDPIVSWLYELPIVNNLCNPQSSKESFCTSPVLPSTHLPPFIYRIGLYPKYE